MWVPFWRPFPGHETHKLVSGGPKWVVSVEKVYVRFPSPSNLSTYGVDKPVRGPHVNQHLFARKMHCNLSPDRVARGLPTGGQGSKVYVLCAEPKKYKHFRPGTRPGGYRVPGREDR